MRLSTLFFVCVVFTSAGTHAHAGQTAGVGTGDVSAGEKRYLQNCVNCHGKKGKGMASFPPILGRDADYIRDRLTKYRAKEKVGPNSAIMMSLTGQLSDAEIANLAAYIAAAFK